MPSVRFRSALAALPVTFALSGCFGVGGEAPSSVPLGIAPLGEATVEILHGAPLLERIRLGPHGVAFGPPKGAVERALFADDGVREELSALVTTYAPFAIVVGANAVRFRGQGSVSAPPYERRWIAEWARFVAMQSTGFADGEEPAPVLFWQRGGEGSECKGLEIDRTGGARGGCSHGRGAPRRLAGAELERLYGWFDALEPFQISWLEGPAGEERTLRLVFAGAGQRVAAEEDRKAIAAFAAALAAEWPDAASLRFAPPPSRAPLRRALVLPLRPPPPYERPAARDAG